MRSIGLLLKRLFWLAIKLVLVAIPAVIASFCSYRLAMRDALANEHAITAVMSQMADVLDRQGRSLEVLRGEVNVLTILAASRQLPLSPSERLLMPSPQANQNVGGPKILIRAVPVDTKVLSAR